MWLYSICTRVTKVKEVKIFCNYHLLGRICFARIKVTAYMRQSQQKFWSAHATGHHCNLIFTLIIKKYSASFQFFFSVFFLSYYSVFALPVAVFYNIFFALYKQVCASINITRDRRMSNHHHQQQQRQTYMTYYTNR